MGRDIASVAAMGTLFLLANVAALVIVPFYQAVGIQAFEDPSDPVNPFIYILLILLFTGMVLAFVRMRREYLVRYLFLGAMFFTMFFVYLIPIAFAFVWVAEPAFSPLVYGYALVLAGVLTYGLHAHPEWWLVDAVGVSVSAGIIAILGLSLTILPVFLLLAFLAVYDAISVYKTKHMIALADAVTAQRLPILLVIPKTWRYSFMRQPRLGDQIAKGEEREAMFMGLGDVILPGILVVAAWVWLWNDPLVLGLPAALVVALGTLLGSAVGFAVLMRYVLRGRPQAGLPLLNGGAMIGFLLTAAAVYGLDVVPGIFALVG
jgi:presenilin-like A22 family membrane protease